MKRLGFSLGETVFCTALLTLVAGFCLQLLPNAMMSIRRVECSWQAQSLAEASLESARAQGFSALAVGVVGAPAQTVDNIIYQTQRTVYLVGTTPATSLKGLRVLVTWQFRGSTYTAVRESLMSAVKS